MTTETRREYWVSLSSYCSEGEPDEVSDHTLFPRGIVDGQKGHRFAEFEGRLATYRVADYGSIAATLEARDIQPGAVEKHYIARGVAEKIMLKLFPLWSTQFEVNGDFPRRRITEGDLSDRADIATARIQLQGPDGAIERVTIQFYKDPVAAQLRDGGF